MQLCLQEFCQLPHDRPDTFRHDEMHRQTGFRCASGRMPHRNRSRPLLWRHGHDVRRRPARDETFSLADDRNGGRHRPPLPPCRDALPRHCKGGEARRLSLLRRTCRCACTLFLRPGRELSDRQRQRRHAPDGRARRHLPRSIVHGKGICRIAGNGESGCFSAPVEYCISSYRRCDDSVGQLLLKTGARPQYAWSGTCFLSVCGAHSDGLLAGFRREDQDAAGPGALCVHLYRYPKSISKAERLSILHNSFAPLS